MANSSAPEVEVKGQVGDWVLGKIVKKAPECGLKEMIADITIILDRSGSMGSIREATVKAVNDYMRNVDEVPGKGCWTLVTFDEPQSALGAKEAFPHTVFAQADAKRRPLLELQDYQPRGGTALIDAVYETVALLRERVKDQDNRRVLVVIMTDGYENQSRRYTRGQLRELIASCIAAGWEFVYLGANQDAFAEAASIGTQQTCSPFFAGVSANWRADGKGIDCCLNAAQGSATAGTRAWKAANSGSFPSLQSEPNKAQVESSK